MPSWPSSSGTSTPSSSRRFADGLTLVLGRRPDPELIDGLQAIGSPALYLHLVRKSGWTHERYQQWLAHTLLQLVAHIPEESA